MSFTTIEEWYVMSCCHEGCHVMFAVTKEVESRLRETQEWFQCPFGHQQRFGISTELDKARRQAEKAERDARIAQAQANAARHEAEVYKRQTAAQKGQVTKLKRRAAHGVCLCCNRQFKDLARHMESKHPEFQVEAGITPRQIEGSVQ